MLKVYTLQEYLAIGFALFAAAAMIAGAYVGQPERDMRTPKARVAEDTVFMIYNNQGSGTGTWISPTELLTNCHVAVNLGKKGMAKNFDNSVYFKVHSSYCDKTTDLAIVSTSSGEYAGQVAKIADQQEGAGAEVWSAGYGMRWGLTYKNALIGYPLPGYMVPVDTLIMAIGPGDSGSPVFGVGNRIIGVAAMGAIAYNFQRRVFPVGNRGGMVPLSQIKDFLATYRGTREIPYEVMPHR